MHDCERIKSRAQVVYHNAGAFGKPLQPANWEWFPDIEDTKEYKARDKRFPSERDGDESNELSCNFVNDDELRVFHAGGACNLCSGGNSDERNYCGRDDRCPGAVR